MDPKTIPLALAAVLLAAAGALASLAYPDSTEIRPAPTTDLDPDCTNPASDPACVCGLPLTPPCPPPNPCTPSTDVPCQCNPSPPFVPACRDPCRVPAQQVQAVPVAIGGPHCGPGCGQNPEPPGCDVCIQHHTPEQCRHCLEQPNDEVCNVECDADTPPAYCRDECYHEPAPPHCNPDCAQFTPSPPHCRPECAGSSEEACAMCYDWMANPSCNPCTGTHSPTPCPEECRVPEPPSHCKRGTGAPGSSPPAWRAWEAMLTLAFGTALPVSS